MDSQKRASALKCMITIIPLIAYQIISQPDTRSIIRNLLSEPKYISNQPSSLVDESSNLKSTGEFTLFFWFRYNDIPPSSSVNILSLYNPAPESTGSAGKVISFDKRYPACPVSLSYIDMNPSYAENPYLKSNPNCFLGSAGGSLVSQTNPIDYLQKMLEVNIYKKDKVMLLLSLPMAYDDKTGVFNYLTQNLQDVPIEFNEWLFIAISVDYANNIGTVFVNNAAHTSSSFRVDFELKLPKLELKKDYRLLLSENFSEKSAVYGYIYDVNVAYLFMKLPELLRFYSFDGSLYKTHNIVADLIFDKGVYDVRKSPNDFDNYYRILGQYQVTNAGIEFKPRASVEIGTIDNYPLEGLVKSLNFYFTVEILSSSARPVVLVSALDKNGSEVLVISLIKDGSSKDISYVLEVKLPAAGLNYKTSKPLKARKATSFVVSLIQTDNSTLNVFFASGKSFFEVSPSFNSTVNLSNLSFVLLNAENDAEVLMSRFVLMNTPLPYIIVLQDNPKTKTGNNRCEISMEPRQHPKSCLQCENAVLLPQISTCVEFCPKGRKNLSGVCVECYTPACNEIEKTSFEIIRLNNTSFLLQLSNKIGLYNSKNLTKAFDVEIDGLVLGQDFGYKINSSSATAALVNLEFFQRVYNTTMRVRSIYDDEEVYDSNRNSIGKLEAVYLIPSIHYLSPTNENIVQVLSYVMFSIFLILILIGLALFALSFKYNLNEYGIKKLAVLFRNLQLVPLLLFLHVAFPSNLYIFLSTLYGLILEFNAAVIPIDLKATQVQANVSHPNFFDRELSSLFIGNFGAVFLLHSILAAFYLFLVLSKCFYRLMSMNVKILLIKTREVFEFNILILALLLFDYQIFVFTGLNFQYPTAGGPFGVFSFIISLIYQFVIIGVAATFFIIYSSKSKFIPQSETKFKLSFLFIGYRNRPVANCFELAILALNFSVSCVLVYLRSMPIIQIVLFLAFYIIFSALTIIIKPFETKKETGLDILNRGLLITAWTMIAILAVDDMYRSYDADFRENIGWITIALIVAYVCLNFIVASAQLAIFIYRIRLSTQLIFYDKEEDFRRLHVHKLASKLPRLPKSDEDIEEKPYRDSKLGKLGNLVRTDNNGLYHSEIKVKPARENLDLECIESCRKKATESFSSNSDDTFASDKYSISNEFKANRD